jgi:hypothetical protein
VAVVAVAAALAAAAAVPAELAAAAAAWAATTEPFQLLVTLSRNELRLGLRAPTRLSSRAFS